MSKYDKKNLVDVANLLWQSQNIAGIAVDSHDRNPELTESHLRTLLEKIAYVEKMVEQELAKKQVYLVLYNESLLSGFTEQLYWDQKTKSWTRDKHYATRFKLEERENFRKLADVGIYIQEIVE